MSVSFKTRCKVAVQESIIVFQHFFHESEREGFVQQLIRIFTIEPYSHKEWEDAQCTFEVKHVSFIAQIRIVLLAQFVIIVHHNCCSSAVIFHTLDKQEADVTHTFVQVDVLPIQEGGVCPTCRIKQIGALCISCMPTALYIRQHSNMRQAMTLCPHAAWRCLESTTDIATQAIRLLGS